MPSGYSTILLKSDDRGTWGQHKSECPPAEAPRAARRSSYASHAKPLVDRVPHLSNEFTSNARWPHPQRQMMGSKNWTGRRRRTPSFSTGKKETLVDPAGQEQKLYTRSGLGGSTGQHSFGISQLWTTRKRARSPVRQVHHVRVYCTRAEKRGGRGRLPPDHLLLDSAPNLGPLTSRWEINKFEIADTKVSGF